jgi:hypothetical protein
MTEKKTPPLPTVFCEEVFDENSLPSEDGLQIQFVQMLHLLKLIFLQKSEIMPLKLAYSQTKSLNSSPWPKMVS